MNRIVKLTQDIVAAPLRHPFVTAQHTVTAMAAVRVQIELADGTVAAGAATPNLVVTGDTIASVRHAVDAVLAAVVLGRDLDDWTAILADVRAADVSEPARAAVEIALYNARAVVRGVTLVELLGGPHHGVTTDYTVSIAAVPAMIAEAKALVAQGVRCLKIKVGSADLAADIALVAAIAAAVGPTIELRIDANQGWTSGGTGVAARAWQQDHLNIAFIEQPVPAADVAALKEARTVSPLPIMADEAVHSYEDAARLVALGACDYINIKLMKAGGLTDAIRINALCAQNGVGCMIGCMIEAPISLGAAVAFAAAHENVKFVDLDAAFMFDETAADIAARDYTVAGMTLTPR